jgi:hypothetical protein
MLDTSININSKIKLIMVTVTSYDRRQSEDGREFFTITLQGGVEIVKSQNGKTYMTIRKTSIPSTFDENVCASLIGTQMPGDIERVECDPYEYQNKETGEVVVLHHTYNYVPEEKKQVEKPVSQPPLVPFSLNGQSVFAEA